jgi:acyl-CoA reductase-like NAD-dependent aldehyde dehydrogenase
MALSETVASTQLLIGGEERPAPDTFAVYDPHDGSVAGHAAAASREQALDAVAAARAAWPAWAALTAADRAERALASLEGLDADAGERAETLVRENGKV